MGKRSGMQLRSSARNRECVRGRDGELESTRLVDDDLVMLRSFPALWVDEGGFEGRALAETSRRPRGPRWRPKPAFGGDRVVELLRCEQICARGGVRAVNNQIEDDDFRRGAHDEERGQTHRRMSSCANARLHPTWTWILQPRPARVAPWWRQGGGRERVANGPGRSRARPA